MRDEKKNKNTKITDILSWIGKREPSIKTLCSPYSAKFSRHCVLKDRT